MVRQRRGQANEAKRLLLRRKTACQPETTDPARQSHGRIGDMGPVDPTYLVRLALWTESNMLVLPYSDNLPNLVPLNRGQARF